MVDNTRRSETRDMTRSAAPSEQVREPKEARARAEPDRGQRSMPPLNPADQDMEYLDIPAFLRRQAD